MIHVNHSSQACEYVVQWSKDNIGGNDLWVEIHQWIDFPAA